VRAGVVNQNALIGIRRRAEDCPPYQKPPAASPTEAVFLLLDKAAGRKYRQNHGPIQAGKKVSERRLTNAALAGNTLGGMIV
jgi:hypothetical protein